MPRYELSDGAGNVLQSHDTVMTEAQALQRLAAYRYEKEVGGITVSGASIATDRETQAKLIAVRIMAKEDAGFTVKWKKSDGSFIELTAAQIIAIADAVAAHVQACFTNEAALAASIASAEDPETVDITTGWPV